MVHYAALKFTADCLMGEAPPEVGGNGHVGNGLIGCGGKDHVGSKSSLLATLFNDPRHSHNLPWLYQLVVGI